MNIFELWSVHLSFHDFFWENSLDTQVLWSTSMFLERTILSNQDLTALTFNFNSQESQASILSSDDLIQN